MRCVSITKRDMGARGAPRAHRRHVIPQVTGTNSRACHVQKRAPDRSKGESDPLRLDDFRAVDPQARSFSMKTQWDLYSSGISLSG
jgi:hypothetical protein